MACGEMRRGRSCRSRTTPACFGVARFSQASGNSDGGGRTADRLTRSHPESLNLSVEEWIEGRMASYVPALEAAAASV